MSTVSTGSTDEFVETLSERVETAARKIDDALRVQRLERLTGGASSLTFRAVLAGGTDGGTTVVVKAAPPGVPPLRNNDVLRQARILEALRARPGVPVPRVLFSDPGDPPRVPPFMTTEFVLGESVEPALLRTPAEADLPALRSRALHAVEILATIQQVELDAIGLADEPIVTLESEIQRWERVFASLPADLQGDYARCARSLRASVPSSAAPTISHGDYRLGNMLSEDDTVMAVVDWEIWSVGDPRLDLTWLTLYAEDARRRRHPTGMPEEAELLRVYREAGGPTVEDLPWFGALTRFKHSAISGLLLKRARRAAHVPRSIAALESRMQDRLADALRLLDR